MNNNHVTLGWCNMWSYSNSYWLQWEKHGMKEEMTKNTWFRVKLKLLMLHLETIHILCMCVCVWVCM